jgi:hypothetical protein
MGLVETKHTTQSPPQLPRQRRLRGRWCGAGPAGRQLDGKRTSHTHHSEMSHWGERARGSCQILAGSVCVAPTAQSPTRSRIVKAAEQHAHRDALLSGFVRHRPPLLTSEHHRSAVIRRAAAAAGAAGKRLRAWPLVVWLHSAGATAAHPATTAHQHCITRHTPAGSSSACAAQRTPQHALTGPSDGPEAWIRWGATHCCVCPK